VYARRSVACGEVVLGRSDVDLHVIVGPFRDGAEEAGALALLVRRYRRLQRLLPILGDFDVSTPTDLIHWYRNRPGFWYRDRGWLRLWGESFCRPEPDPADPVLRDSLVRWFLLASDRLPAMLRRSAPHHATNLAIDLLDAHDLLLGHSSTVRSRGAVLSRWYEDDPTEPRRKRLALGYADAFRRGVDDELFVDIQTLALELGDNLAAALGLPRGAPSKNPELRARTPLAARRYLLPDPRSRHAIASALRELRHDPDVVLTTTGHLALRLRYWQPWEWAVLAGAHEPLAALAPRETDYLWAVRCSLHREFARAAAFGRPISTGFGVRLARCRLYLERGEVAALRNDLDRVYHAIYGRSPGEPAVSIDHYFSSGYPESVQEIDALSNNSRLRQ
jgi:hypothetical protein